MPIIEVENISFKYREAKDQALKGVSLTVEPGEFVGIIGPTGAGKSTLCWVLSGVIPQIIQGKLSGKVLVKGLPSNKTPVATISQVIGLVQQDAAAQDRKSVV